jgi:hypothetical protein
MPTRTVRHPTPENLAPWRTDAFGPLFETAGLESARCYLEAARAEARGHRALADAPATTILAWLRRLRSRRSA